MATRNDIVKQAQGWLGKNEKDGSFKIIIDTYNNGQAKLPRGYKMRYTDEWCAAFASAVAIACKATDIIPTECSCSKMIELFKAKGSWQEADSYTPAAGDYIFYDWQDNGKGDNVGSADHVGIVEKVSNGVITVIEGNKGEAVARRTLAVNGRYIRGFGVPKYAAAASPQNTEGKIMIELSELKKGSTGTQVKTLQRLLISLGYKMKNGWRVYGVDGSFGTATYNAVISFQKAKGLAADGIVGSKTWNALLK